MQIETRRSRRRTRSEPCDPASLERRIRQRLADKVSGNLAGLWLLVAEHLRLGIWDILCGWTGRSSECVEPRLALQLVHEAAVCTAGIRSDRTLSWKRAGTMNLHIRYGQMTMALLAQAAIHQLRTRLAEPDCHWDASHLAKDLFFALEGDVRVHEDTILVTYYNAPNAAQLRDRYEHLPEKLCAENIPPHVPWLYHYKLDFRFR